MEIRIMDIFGLLSGLCTIYLICGTMWTDMAEDAMRCARIIIFSMMCYSGLSLMGHMDILFWNQGLGRLVLSCLVGIVIELACFDDDIDA